MYSNIKKVAAFTVITFCIIYLLQFTIERIYRQRASDKYARLFAHTLDPDMMIFGSSTAIKHYNPRIIKAMTGYSSHNMGFDGMFFMQNYPLIKEHLSYEKNCKVVVISCSPYLGKDWVVMMPDFFYAYLDNDLVYHSYHEIEPQKFFKAKYIPGYKLTLFNKAFYWRMFYTPKTIDTNYGFEPILDTVGVFERPAPFQQKCDETVVAKLRALTREISAKGVKVVLVLSPYYEEANQFMLNMDHIIARYGSIEDTTKHIYFLDYSKDSITKHKEYFHNHTHLNEKGNEIFTTTFCNDLMRIEGRKE